MLIEESIWIKNAIAENLTIDDFPILNIGSSTANFRMSTQPHIYKNIFLPLLEQKKEVIHLDMKKEEGVDIIGDLSEKEFRDSLKKKGIKSVLCSNLLEHLQDPKPICNSILNLLEKGGIIIVTVPYSFPFHKDPIDTMFRPSIEELNHLFPGTSVVAAEIVQTDGSYKKDLLKNKSYLFKMILRWCLPFYKYKEWQFMIRDLFSFNQKYSATCLLLKKNI